MLLCSDGETASRYPVEAVRTMTRVAVEVENNKEKFLEIPALNVAGEISSYLVGLRVKTSVRLGARGFIIADTIGGRSIRDMAGYRGYKIVLAQCYSKSTMRSWPCPMVSMRVTRKDIIRTTGLSI